MEYSNIDLLDYKLQFTYFQDLFDFEEQIGNFSNEVPIFHTYVNCSINYLLSEIIERFGTNWSS